MAACRCSSARYDDRTSGPEKTEPKPSASPCSRSQRNSSGCTQRSIVACFELGCRYWPMVATSTPVARRARIVSTPSPFVSPPPTCVRLAGVDVAVAARARARVAEDLERRCAAPPALRDVWAARLLADRVQREPVHELLHVEVARVLRRRAHLHPLGPARALGDLKR